MTVVSDGRRGSISFEEALEVVSVLAVVVASLLSIPMRIIPVVSSSPRLPSVVPEISDMRDDLDTGRGASSPCATSIEVGFVGDRNGSSTTSASTRVSVAAAVDKTASAILSTQKGRVSTNHTAGRNQPKRSRRTSFPVD